MTSRCQLKRQSKILPFSGQVKINMYPRRTSILHTHTLDSYTSNVDRRVRSYSDRKTSTLRNRKEDQSFRGTVAVMDVSKMFKLPNLPASAGQKRKFTDAPTPGTWQIDTPFALFTVQETETSALMHLGRVEMLKRYRPTESEDMPPPPVPSNGNSKGKARAATVSEEADEEDAQGRFP
jgi:hypothetical protein